MSDRNESAGWFRMERWKRYLPVVLILAAGVGFTMLAFSAMRGRETRKIRSDFSHEAGNRAKLIRRAMA